MSNLIIDCYSYSVGCLKEYCDSMSCRKVEILNILYVVIFYFRFDALKYKVEQYYNYRLQMDLHSLDCLEENMKKVMKKTVFLLA